MRSGRGGAVLTHSHVLATGMSNVTTIGSWHPGRLCAALALLFGVELWLYRQQARLTHARATVGSQMVSARHAIDAREQFATAEIGARVLLWQVQQQGTAALGMRLLDERHFEFRGGWFRGQETDLRTRVCDPAFNGPV